MFTDFDGSFSIKAPLNGLLTISFIGFNTKTVSIENKDSLVIVLTQATEELKDVVIIGYTTQKRTDVTNAISSVKSADLENLKQVSVDQMLQGKAAGVVVTNASGQPGSNVSVKIRGVSSLFGSTEPLYVVDGVPISGDATGRATSGRPLVGNDFSPGSGQASNVTVSPIAFLNPNDIETIDILKDASATAIYGSRGANGVVIITTKTGKKGTGKINYDITYSIQEQKRFLEVLDLQGYAKLQNGLIDALVLTTPKNPNFAQPQLLGSGTNWQQEIYNPAAMKTHQLSFSGRKEDLGYFLSGSYTDQEGTVIGSGFKRYTFRTNLDSQVKNWMKVGANINTGITNENITLNGSQNGIISTSLLGTPDISVKNPDGSFAGPPINTEGVYFRNPIAEAISNTNKLVRKNFSGNIFAEFKLFKGLEYKFELGTFIEFVDGKEFRPTFDWGATSNKIATLDRRTSNFYSYNVKNQLTYKNNFGKNNVTILAGQEANEGNWEGNNVKAIGFADNTLPQFPVASKLEALPASYYSGTQRLYSVFGQLIYSFDNKYILSGSMRADGSSKFATGKKWGYFPAVSLAWKFSNESFVKDFKAITNIKFRAGYGETGNQQIPNNTYSAVLASYLAPPQLGTIAPFRLTSLTNPDITWEKQKQVNFGLDFSLFNSNLSASIDYYIKDSEDFLAQFPLPFYLTGGNGGVAGPYSNLGQMTNKGIDISVRYNKKFKNNFTWNSSLVFSKYETELVKSTISSILLRAALINDFTTKQLTKTEVGGSLGTFTGLDYRGIYRDNATAAAGPKNGFGNTVIDFVAGDAIYKDINGDGIINDLDNTIIGDPNPEFTYGFTNNFNYKNFDLSIFMQGSVGNDILNLTRRAGTSNSSLFQNQFVEALDFYSPTNQNASLPRPTSINHPNLNISSRYVEDGTYLRIQNVTVGYSLPLIAISQIHLTKLKLFLSAQNLFTFTNYTGYDPEIGPFNQDVLLNGVDNGRYPTPRVVSIGVNVEF